MLPSQTWYLSNLLHKHCLHLFKIYPKTVSVKLLEQLLFSPPITQIKVLFIQIYLYLLQRTHLSNKTKIPDEDEGRLRMTVAEMELVAENFIWLSKSLLPPLRRKQTGKSEWKQSRSAEVCPKHIWLYTSCLLYLYVEINRNPNCK